MFCKKVYVMFGKTTYDKLKIKQNHYASRKKNNITHSLHTEINSRIWRFIPRQYNARQKFSRMIKPNFRFMIVASKTKKAFIILERKYFLFLI